MTDYISRKMFIERVKDIPFWGSVAVLIAEQLPAADVRPVARGKWDDDGYGWVRCSICRGAIAVARGGNRFNYCPNCGADMRDSDG